MGVYRRKDSPYYWLLLERPGTRPILESSRIPHSAHNAILARQNRKLAEDLYVSRMAELAKARIHREERIHEILAKADKAPAPVPPTLSEYGWCYIYFAQHGDRIKIGKAVDVNGRLKTLQTGNAERLTLILTVPAHAALERAIHKRFASHKVGGEWFQLTPDLQAFIEKLRTGANPVALLYT